MTEKRHFENEVSCPRTHRYVHVHGTPSEQGHAQSFSNYSLEALIEGNELMGDSVVSTGIPTSNTPDIIENYALSADFLIGSNDLSSSLSYAIDNLISSRSDANYNSTAMVSVKPNLLYSVKSNVSHDASKQCLYNVPSKFCSFAVHIRNS